MGRYLYDLKFLREYKKHKIYLRKMKKNYFKVKSSIHQKILYTESVSHGLTENIWNAYKLQRICIENIKILTVRKMAKQFNRKMIKICEQAND